jgi:hypothetical protein
MRRLASAYLSVKQLGENPSCIQQDGFFVIQNQRDSFDFTDNFVGLPKFKAIR